MYVKVCVCVQGRGGRRFSAIAIEDIIMDISVAIEIVN